MRKSLSVKQFNEYFKSNLKHDPIFSNVHINGSLANIRVNNSHLYFSLKEEYDIIDCVIYYFEEKDIDFNFSEGINVIITGNLKYNNYSSKIVISVNDIEEKGISEEYRNFIKMKEEFNKKGYFDIENKKDIPKLVKNIGLITSKDGAAVVDFISVINQIPNDINIVLYPVRVQGESARSKIIDAINYLEDKKLDLIVITRGGGSSEDLSIFNDREIIETVFKANTPIISAIGHKIDTTLLDLVSDLSLQTPTEAGSVIISGFTNINKNMKDILFKMRNILLDEVRIDEVRINAIKRTLNTLSPINQIMNKYREVENLKNKIDLKIESNLNYNRHKIELIKVNLDNQKKLLELRKKNISIKDMLGDDIYSKYSLKIGDKIQINFSDGKVLAKIDDE